MGKKWAFAIVALLTMFMILGWYGWFRTPWAKIGFLEAIPHNSPFIVRIDNYMKWDTKIAQTDYQEALMSTPVFSKIKKDYTILDSLTKKIPALRLLRESSFVAAAQVSRADDFDYLYIWTEVPNFKEKDWAISITNESTFSSNQIYEIIENERTRFSFTKYDNLIIGSSSPLLVEYALTQINNYIGCLVQNSSFNTVYKSTKNKKADMVLFANPANIALFSSIFTPTNWTSFGKTLSWIGTTLYLHPHSISLNGRGTIQRKKRFP